jgi:hypothetical protein
MLLLKLSKLPVNNPEVVLACSSSPSPSSNIGGTDAKAEFSVSVSAECSTWRPA